ncbi:Hypothetical protein A7982_00295 [Minicystis rosea]|nr:Hypothetical protein A7982_00295 [Minicystis rosea]
MALRTTLSMMALAVTSVLLPACNKPIPPPDPKGKDIVAGAVVAAVTTAEKEPGIRTYKVIHVDDYPEPVGHNYHLIAYDPKAKTFEEARELRWRGVMTVVLPHFEVRAVDFLPRDHRVLGVEPLSDQERSAYEKARTGQ